MLEQNLINSLRTFIHFRGWI